jgi:predicted transcriptional regulator
MISEMSEQTSKEDSEQDIRRMTAEIVAAFVAANTVQAPQLPELIRSVFTALNSLDSQAELPSAEPLKPAVPIRKSVTRDYIVCLEDGKKLKMLKRHLRTTYDMSPDEYRAKWSLPADYPMVAPAYAERRSEFAKKIGLGRKAAEPRKGRRARA